MLARLKRALSNLTGSRCTCAYPLFVEKALELGASQQAIDALGWGSMFSANLLPVTLGNILGEAFFVGLAYWLAYRRAA